MKPLLPPRTPLHAWSHWVTSAVDAQLFAVQEAQRALLRAPFVRFESGGLMPPAIETAVRVQDAMTRVAYQSLVALNRLAGVASGQLIDRFAPPPRNDS